MEIDEIVKKLSIAFSSNKNSINEDGWVLDWFFKKMPSEYTAITISAPSEVDLEDEATCNKIFECIVNTFDFTKKNVDYIPEMNNFSVIIPGNVNLKFKSLLKEIVKRYDLD